MFTRLGEGLRIDASEIACLFHCFTKDNRSFLVKVMKLRKQFVAGRLGGGLGSFLLSFGFGSGLCGRFFHYYLTTIHYLGC
jgi:hypothetical protein